MGLNLLKYFISADEDLPPSYVKKCKKFLEKIKQKNKSSSSQAGGPSHKDKDLKRQLKILAHEINTIIK